VERYALNNPVNFCVARILAKAPQAIKLLPAALSFKDASKGG
jgi:hypothetical protein